jgi:hypothetical protein
MLVPAFSLTTSHLLWHPMYNEHLDILEPPTFNGDQILVHCWRYRVGVVYIRLSPKSKCVCRLLSFCPGWGNSYLVWEFRKRRFPKASPWSKPPKPKRVPRRSLEEIRGQIFVRDNPLSIYCFTTEKVRKSFWRTYFRKPETKKDRKQQSWQKPRISRKSV